MQVSKNTVALSIVGLPITVLCYYRKVMCYECYSLATVAIGKGEPGQVHNIQYYEDRWHFYHSLR